MTASPAEGWTLDNAIAFAKKHDLNDLFDERADVGPHAVQSGVSAIAACVIRYGEKFGGSAMGVERNGSRSENAGARGLSRVENSVASFLSSCFRAVPRPQERRAPFGDRSASLIELASHPNEDVKIMAFQALFLDPDPHVKWVAAHFAFDLAHYIDPIQNEKTFVRNDTEDRAARGGGFGESIGCPWCRNRRGF